jgi:hypothetical protein
MGDGLIHTKIARTILRHSPACAIDIIEVIFTIIMRDSLIHTKIARTLFRHYTVCAIKIIKVTFNIIVGISPSNFSPSNHDDF